MKSSRIKKYLKTGLKLKLFERKLEFWNLFENESFENWNFEKIIWKLNLRIGILKNYLKIEVLKIIWKLEFWKLEFWKLEFWKIIWK